MYASRPLKSLLAFAMAALLFFASRPAAAQPKEILLPFTFNEVPKGEVAVYLQGDDVFIAPADLQRSGMTGAMWRRLTAFARLVSGARKIIGGKEYLSLKAMAPYLGFKFDEATLSLSVTATPELLAETQLNVQLGPPADIVYSRDTSTFLNYSVTTQSGRHPTFFGESGTSIAGNLLLNTFARSQQRNLVRLLSSYEMDERARLRRWTLGDANVTSDLLGGAALIGGVTISRNFNLDPYFVRFPPLDLRGTALTPSRVEVYVNGAMVAQQDVPPGPFELRNIPVASGSGNARIVVRDVFGREQVLNQPFYYSTGVLERGLSEFTYSAGVLRRDFGSRSFDYGQPAFLAFHRYGFTDALTAGGRVEGSRDLISGGPTVAWRTRIGEFDLAAAGSRDHGRSGEAAMFGYSYLAHSFSVGGFGRAQSREYANLSLSHETDRSLRDTNLFVTLLFSRANFTLQWNDAHNRDQPDTKRITLLGNLPVSRRSSVFVSVGSADEGMGRKAEVFAGLSFFLGGSSAASITVDHRNGQTQTVTEFDKTLPVGTGFGYRITAAGNGDRQTGNGLLQYQTSFGRYEMQFDPFHASVRPTITASGGLVYQGGALLATRPVQDSFALVRVPGVRDVRVFASNNQIGRTNANGDLLVPNLLPYYGNRLSIEDSDIPLNYEVAEVEKTIAPPNRGGALVVFPVRQVRTITGSVIVRDAKNNTAVPSFGELTLTAGGQNYQSPLGRQGEFYLENVPSGTHTASVDFREGHCAFSLQIPEGSAAVVKLGQLSCVMEGGR